nr:MAG TPA: hypothetical protein [Caudoviricetes sp.]
MPHLVPAVLVLEGVKYCRGYSVRNTRAPRLTLWGSLLTRLADQQ